MHALTVADHVAVLLPNGADRCPIWPPDVFAVVASLADRTGFYAEPGIVLSTTTRERQVKRAWADRAVSLGEDWRTKGKVPPEVDKLWHRFTLLASCALADRASTQARTWKRLAHRLLEIADEASTGMGFIPDADNLFAQFAFDQLGLSLREMPTVLRCPSSICIRIDPDILCVMPKSLTPGVGCTLRSLTHHLALLPGQGTVRAHWCITAPLPNSEEISPQTTEFNVLVVPYPYCVARADFQVAKPPTDEADGYFALSQGWLDGKGTQHRVEFAKFLADLVRMATTRLDNGVVHAVVLPETALDPAFAEAASERLRSVFPGMEAFIVGMLEPGMKLAKNKARLYLPRAQFPVDQSKHHRWVLNGGQIRQYQLGRTLDPSGRWWENINISDRQIWFALLRQDIVVSTLVCEDLARFDPVLPVINAVGPNLVVALLMDGPQLQARWPGRYATVLAEDPGSAVLSVTSLGMAKLARRYREPENRVVALWKDAGGGPAQELYLPPDAQGLLLCLSSRDDEARTMGGRSDGTATVRLGLDEVWPVTAALAPAWLPEVR